jgi:ferredoxin
METKGLVYTIRCRPLQGLLYCVRECPVKAIKIVNGQPK